MTSLNEFLCQHSITYSYPSLEELLAYLPVRFQLHNFDYILYENSDNKSVNSMDSSLSAFYSDDSPYFSQNF